MANNRDSNYVSVWFWMFALFVMAIPCVGLVMIVVWAFAGENESRKNYFKALIIWFLIWIVIAAAIAGLGFWPEIQKHFQHLKS